MPAQSKIALHALGGNDMKNDTPPAWMILLKPSIQRHN
jgi:hypothetical protein